MRRISLFQNKIRNDFNEFYRYLNNSWKPIPWVLSLLHRLPKTTTLFRNNKYISPHVKEFFFVNSIQYVNLKAKIYAVAVPKFKMTILIVCQLDSNLNILKKNEMKSCKNNNYKMR